MENNELKFRLALAMVIADLEMAGKIEKIFNWVAVDKNGDVYAYDYRPSKDGDIWDNPRAEGVKLGSIGPSAYGPNMWEKSRHRIENLVRFTKYDFAKIAFDLDLPKLFEIAKKIPASAKWIATDANSNVFAFESDPFISGTSVLPRSGNATYIGNYKYYTGNWNLSILKVEDAINTLKQRGFSVPPRNYEAPVKVVPKPAPVPKPKNDAAELIEAQIRDRQNKIESLQNEIKSLTDAARILRGR